MPADLKYWCHWLLSFSLCLIFLGNASCKVAQWFQSTSCRVFEVRHTINVIITKHVYPPDLFTVSLAVCASFFNMTKCPAGDLSITAVTLARTQPRTSNRIIWIYVQAHTREQRCCSMWTGGKTVLDHTELFVRNCYSSGLVMLCITRADKRVCVYMCIYLNIHIVFLLF